jgi:hypothetical protein
MAARFAHSAVFGFISWSVAHYAGFNPLTFEAILPAIIAHGLNNAFYKRLHTLGMSVRKTPAKNGSPNARTITDADVQVYMDGIPARVRQRLDALGYKKLIDLQAVTRDILPNRDNLKNPGPIRMGGIIALAKALETNVTWLLTGLGPMQPLPSGSDSFAERLQASLYEEDSLRSKLDRKIGASVKDYFRNGSVPTVFYLLKIALAVHRTPGYLALGEKSENQNFPAVIFQSKPPELSTMARKTRIAA